jgi:hypothetical protein
MMLLFPVAYAQEKTTTTTTTTVEAVSQTQAPVKKVSKPVVRRKSAAPAPKVEATTIQSTTTTTEVIPPPPKEVVHKVYDEEMLKKMSKELCTDGFKAYVGGHKKNVCQSKAMAPDIAYTCVWDKDGPPAFAPSAQGPCNLDYTNHSGSIVIKKETFSSSPPLGYGTEVQCCFRPAKGIETSSLNQ